ncbi:hypothetical protein Sste5346_006194 [Sporothrix stenoceras]|uniref:Zn(2)-C6 fungal-type domain-containing protein n=1 Tax=Sporothrix stenoceras TaxID=5173 RepID=A0ABR3Z1I1_9PEZI
MAEAAATTSGAMAETSAATGGPHWSASGQRSRKRSVLACQLCHSRKVRCNVTQSGPPCANCAQDGVRCETVDKGRQRRRFRLARMLSEGRVDAVEGSHGPTHRDDNCDGSVRISENASSSLANPGPVATPPPPPPPRSAPASVAMARLAMEAREGTVTTTSTSPQRDTTMDSGMDMEPAELMPEINAHRPLPSARTAAPVLIETSPSLPPPTPLSSEPQGLDYAAILDEEDRGDGEDANEDGSEGVGGDGQRDKSSHTSSGNPDPASGTTVLYVGDQQGLGFVVNICQPQRAFPGNNHFVVPRAAAHSAALLPEDMAALKARGCFSLPADAVQKVLLRCYFHHVHSFLPILHAGEFVYEYETRGPQKVNLLLLWSMFFAASNFLSDDEVRDAGYASRKAMKHAMYSRAKALYDTDYEKNKIPLIQSVILLAFWFVDAEDRNGSWHWIGIAISLCQTIGLHRTLYLERRQQRRQRTDGAAPMACQGPTPPAQRRMLSSSALLDNGCCRLWRLIWWTCYFRDTWLSYGMGRPTRISLGDCDTPLPVASDMDELWVCRSRAAAAAYFPPADATRTLSRLWTHLLEMTFALGHILRTHYQAKAADGHGHPDYSQAGDSAGPPAIDRDWARLLRCRAAFPSEDAGDQDSPVVLSHIYHLHIYYEASVVALHRPYLARGPAGGGGSKGSRQSPWRMHALRRASIAAANINGLINRMMTSRLTEVCQPMMVTAVIPALQIHMFMTVSGPALTQSLARHQLDIGMIFLSELRRTYWAADLTYALFFRARQKLAASAWCEDTEKAADEMDASNTRADARADAPAAPRRPTELTEPKQAAGSAMSTTSTIPAVPPLVPPSILGPGYASSDMAASTVTSSIETDPDLSIRETFYDNRGNNHYYRVGAGMGIDLDGMDMNMFLDDLFPTQLSLLSGAAASTNLWSSPAGSSKATDVDLNLILNPDELANFYHVNQTER